MEVLCPIRQFLTELLKLCRSTAEISSYSPEILLQIDETARKASFSDLEDKWELALRPWSPTVGWQWLEGADKEVDMPVYLENCKGPLCDKFKAFLPNHSLNEVTAIYIFCRIMAICEDEDEDNTEHMMQYQLGSNLEFSDDNIVFVICRLPDCDEPHSVDIGFFETGTKLSILGDIFRIPKKLYSQSY
ncbi:MAG: hypothetical protein P4L69_03160 [Desulfosporosinus sp.]|nr:hypothetical protein [Desulfosporosinus sp.]